MSKALVVGKEQRSYADKTTGELKQYRAMHVVWQDKKKDGLTGSMVETVSVPRELDFDSVQVNTIYRLHYGSIGGRYARLEEIELVKA